MVADRAGDRAGDDEVVLAAERVGGVSHSIAVEQS
jgi:hypothetical protein